MQLIGNSIINGRAALILALSTFALFTLSYIAYADASGKTGKTNSGCTCHTQNSATVVTCSSQNGWTVAPNSVNTFTVNVANASFSYAGVDIGVKTTSGGETNSGTLAPGSGSGLKSASGELTQSSPKSYSGSCDFQFTWTAPATPGTYYLKSCGMAVNNNGGSGGDQYNFMAVQTITVSDPASVTITSPNGGENWCPASSHNITWTFSGISNVKIELSSDAGSSWFQTLVSSVPASSGSWAWNILPSVTSGNQFLVKVSDATNASLSSTSAAVFAIPPTTAVIDHPQPLTVCAGLPAQFSVTAAGSNLAYKWRRNLIDITGATGATYNIPAVSSANAGSYSCIITGACGTAVTSNAAILTVEDLPNITQNPQTKTVCEGTPAMFSVTATGTEIKYQWRKDSSPINGADSATYTINSPQATDAGAYDCVVTGKCSPSKTSTVANLIVNTPPQIESEPMSTEACAGKKAILFVKASGAGLSYQWFKNGTAVPNSNNDTLSFASLTPADSGVYYVSVSGTCTPSVQSADALLRVLPLPQITVQPKSADLTIGQRLSLSVAVPGTGISYQWFKNSKNLSGKTSDTLLIVAVSLSDSGSYNCEVSNSCGTITSSSAKVTVAQPKPGLTLSDQAIDFGLVEVNSFVTRQITLSNTGSVPFLIDTFKVIGADTSEFIASGFISNTQIPPNASKVFYATFKPLSAGNKSALVNFETNIPNTPKLTLSGKGFIINLAPDTTALSLIAAKAGDTTLSNLKIGNKSSIDINIHASVSGKDSALFTLVSTADLKISSGGSGNVSIVFKPTAAIPATAYLNLLVKENSKTYTYALTGSTATSVDELMMEQTFRASPNPMSEGISIRFLSISGIEFRALIYDLSGALVKDFGCFTSIIGTNELHWDGRDRLGSPLPSGVYTILIHYGSSAFSAKIILNK